MVETRPFPFRTKEFIMGDFIGSTMFFVVMGAALVGLIILFVIMQKKKNDE